MNDPTKPRDDAGPSVPAEAAVRSSSESRVIGPGPSTRSYLVLDPQKLTTKEIASAIMAMVEASRNRGK